MRWESTWIKPSFSIAEKSAIPSSSICGVVGQNHLNGFAKADDTLSVAAKSIAEIITVRGLINLDFNDVRTVLKDGGVAIMSTGFGEGDGRVRKAIDDALNSPLLNDNDIYNSQKILLSIAFSSENGTDGLAMEEMNEINDFMPYDDYFRTSCIFV